MSAVPPHRRTLLVRHVPTEMGEAEVTSFFRHFGATFVRVMCKPPRLARRAFVTFDSPAGAESAMQRLQGFDFMGRKLEVEWAHGRRDQVDASVATPIAPELNVTYPFPPHLRYAYPPPSREILHNISAALVAVPRFYTQVLHLMNKMNLPAPFGAMREIPPTEEDKERARQERQKKREMGLESDESELESDDDAQQKKATAAAALPHKKRKRDEPVLPPAATEPLPSAPIPAPRQPAQPQVIKMAPIQWSSVLAAQTSKAAPAERPPPPTLEKLPDDVLRMNPAMRGYTRGQPCNVLFARNVPRGPAAQERLDAIFGQVDGFLEAKLLTDRMKGQAFVTFANAEGAGQALDMLHGSVIDERPLILQFSKSASATLTGERRAKPN